MWQEIQNVSILVAIGVSSDGYREIIGASEGLKEDFESWKNFFVWLKQRGLTGPKLIIGDKALVCARLRHVASSNWGTKRYLNMEHLTSMILSDDEEHAAS